MDGEKIGEKLPELEALNEEKLDEWLEKHKEDMRTFDEVMERERKKHPLVWSL
jgi:hypothetical protein